MQPRSEQITKQAAQKVRIKAYSILFISSTLYAGNVIAGKLIANNVPPVGLSALRGVLGLLIIVPLAWPRLRTSTLPNRKELLQPFVLGFFGITLAYLTFIVGIKYSSGTNASIIAATSPALTNTLLVIGFKAKLNKLQFFGIATSFLGLLIVFTRGSLQHLLTFNLGIGDLILLANVLSMAFGTSLLVPLGVWQLATTPWHPTLFELLIILYMGCCVTGFAFFLNLTGINLIGSGRATIFNNLQPILSIILSVLILGESLAIYHWIGFMFVISGIILSLAKTGQSS